MPTIDPARIRALLDKYQAMHALRVATHAAPPRAELLALASAFPGALRELDRLPLALIEARMRALADVLATARAPEAWMELQSAYHGFMRAALRIRRQLLAQPDLPLDDAPACLVAIAYAPDLGEPPAARFDGEALRVLAKPPRGRLNPWVISQVASDWGVDPSAVQAALLGSL
jgi:hypothetical protein